MSLPSAAEISKMSERDEAKTEKQFRQRKFVSEKLDNDRSGRRPDFLFTRGEDKVVVEVKSVFSAGRTSDGQAVSRLNPSLGGSFSYLDGRVDDILSAAQAQFQELIHDRTEFSSCPFVVALFDNSGFLSPHLLIEEIVPFRNLSAVIMLVKNRKRQESLRKLGLDKLKRLWSGLLKIKIGPDEFEWGVILNTNASVPVRVDLFNPAVENWF